MYLSHVDSPVSWNVNFLVLSGGLLDFTRSVVTAPFLFLVSFVQIFPLSLLLLVCGPRDVSFNFFKEPTLYSIDSEYCPSSFFYF